MTKKYTQTRSLASPQPRFRPAARRAIPLPQAPANAGNWFRSVKFVLVLATDRADLPKLRPQRAHAPRKQGELGSFRQIRPTPPMPLIGRSRNWVRSVNRDHSARPPARGPGPQLPTPNPRLPTPDSQPPAPNPTRRCDRPGHDL